MKLSVIQDISLRKLEVFLAVLDCHSFSKAGRKLGLSQPTVSAHVSALERTFRVSLLDRVSGDILPTAAGSVLQEHATKIVNLSREAVAAVHACQDLLVGDIEIGASTIPGTYLIPLAMVRFREINGQSQIRLTVRSSQKVLELLETGEIELAVVGDSRMKPHLEVKPCIRDRIVLVAPAGHKLTLKEKISIDEIEKYPLIMRQEGSSTQGRVEEALAGMGVVPEKDLKVACTLSSSEAVREGVKRGLGLGFVSRRAVDSELENGSIQVVEIEGVTMERSFSLVRDRRRSPGPIGSAFWSFFTEWSDSLSE
ncbi:MAG: selenium metabolism-associated LysR family transcriptional regulator [Planctomycetota bacterium]|jgi:DNA-binding transcriptional LysR family regulator|nr:selenium metabolism-associated LysR family transcriptional regulator [Planctomycetota bacterium]